MRFIVLREFWFHALFSHLYAVLATRSSVLVQDVSSQTRKLARRRGCVLLFTFEEKRICAARS